MTRSRRHLTVFFAAFGLHLSAVAGASAGTYEVRTCGDAAGRENRSWTFVATGDTSKLESGNGCASGSGEFTGLWVRETLNDGSVGNSNGLVSGYWTFNAPPTTAVTSFTYSRYLRTYDDPDWRSQALSGSGVTLESCDVPAGTGPFCTLGASGGQLKTFSDLNATQLKVGVRCASGSASLFCINGATIHKAQATLYGATVTLTDPLDPSVGSLTGSLFDGGWLRGTRTAQLSASDATGISSLELRRDGGVSVRSTTRTCDDRLAAPCAGSGTSASSDWAAIDTSQLADGTHTFTGVAHDAASNETSSSAVEVRVDNTPPGPPVGLATPSGSWSRQATRAASWSLPGGQAAPIEAAQLSVCPSAGGSCLSPAASTTGSSFTLPAQGRYFVSVKLVDAAGNVSVRPGTTVVGYDATAPAAPLGLRADGVSSAPARTLRWLLPGGQNAPLTKATLVLCRDGGGCFSPASGLTSAAVVLPQPGTFTARVWLTDAAGNTSAAPATTRLEYALASPPSARRAPRMKLTRVRLLKRTVIVRGRLAKRASGRVAVRVAARKRTVTKRVKVRGGAFRAALKLKPRQRGAARAKVRIRYRGDKRFKPRTRTVVVRRDDG